VNFDWDRSLIALDLKRFSVKLQFHGTATGKENRASDSIRFPFFHQAIVHALMKEVARASGEIPGIPPAGRPTPEPRPRSVAAGLIPCVVESGRAAYAPNDEYVLGCTLVQPFAPPPEVVIQALHALSTAKSHAAPDLQFFGNFNVASIESHPTLVAGELTRQYEFLRHERNVVVRLISPFQGNLIGSRTPLTAARFDIQIWLNSVHWRAFTLSTGRRPVQSLPQECPPSPAGLTISNALLFDAGVQKHRQRPGHTPYELLGVIGRITLQDVPEDWWPWLILGQYLNAGEGTGWGFGRYRLDVPEYSPVFHPASSLLNRLADPLRLRSAAERLDQIPGLEMTSLPLIEEKEADLAALSVSLLAGTYSPSPLHGFEIVQHGKLRAIAMAGHADRIVQRATTDLLAPILDALFNQCSFGYRRGRSRADAAHAISQAWDDGFRFALDADITAFFDHVDWERLFAKVEALFPDEPLVPLLRRWVAADVLYQGQRIHRSQGLPLGISVSPMLANLYLDELDDTLESQGFRLVRFADDFVVLTRDAASAQLAQDAARATLLRMGLELNPQKTGIVTSEDAFSYLGYLFCRSLVIDRGLTAPSAPERADLESLPPVVKSTWISQLRPGQLQALTRGGRIHPVANVPSSPPPVRAPVPTVALPAGLAEAPSLQPPTPSTPKQARWGLYVVGRDTGLSLRNQTLAILREGVPPAPVPVEDVSHVVVTGSVRVSSPVLLELGERGIPVFFCKRSGELTGIYQPCGVSRNQFDYHLWLAQAVAAQDTEKRLCFARAVLSAKLARQAETLTRFATPEHHQRATRIQQLACALSAASSLDAMLGLEGSASRLLFEGLQEQLGGLTAEWPFLRRQRKPPPDPVNALLSFGYTLVYIHCATALWTAGLLPQIGLLHGLKTGHLALASDLVEEFRHEVDRLVVRLINRRELRAEHFLLSPSDSTACRLTDDGRRAFILALDGRLHGMDGNAMQIDCPGALPPIRRMERQALAILAFVTGRSPEYAALPGAAATPPDPSQEV
jgi:group II intron reverse transcriptase/maturase/CRISPR-associated endonuclease Cas1